MFNHNHIIFYLFWIIIAILWQRYEIYSNIPNVFLKNMQLMSENSMCALFSWQLILSIWHAVPLECHSVQTWLGWRGKSGVSTIASPWKASFNAVAIGQLLVAKKPWRNNILFILYVKSLPSFSRPPMWSGWRWVMYRWQFPVPLGLRGFMTIGILITQ